MLVYVPILCPFEIFYGHLVYFIAFYCILGVIWYIFPVLFCCPKEKYGKPVSVYIGT
jgi:hypothetical protein